MKRFSAIAACVLLSGSSFAQKTAKKPADPAAARRNLIASGKGALTGGFTDTRNRPFKGVEVFLYAKDSTIVASGYSDSSGHYETNSVLPGVYDVKLVYPNAKRALITGVTLKKGYNPLSVRDNAPSADTSMTAAMLMPKPVEKPTAPKKK